MHQSLPPSAWAARKRSASVLGRHMAYIEEGHGIPIVFLHGNPTSSGEPLLSGRLIAVMEYLGIAGGITKVTTEGEQELPPGAVY